MKFLKLLFYNSLKVLIVAVLFLFSMVPAIITYVFKLNPLFLFLVIPAIVIEYTVIQCYAEKLDKFWNDHYPED